MTSQEQWERLTMVGRVWRWKWGILLSYAIVIPVEFFVLERTLEVIILFSAVLFLIPVFVSLILNRVLPFEAVCPCGNVVILEDRTCEKCKRRTPQEFLMK